MEMAHGRKTERGGERIRHHQDATWNNALAGATHGTTGVAGQRTGRDHAQEASNKTGTPTKGGTTQWAGKR